MKLQADVVIVGAGLAGLVAAVQTTARGKKTLVLDQEPQLSLGGQAFWSLGGLFMINTPQQRRMGIRDSLELATDDWMGSAQFEGAQDYWPRQWAQSYLEFASGEMYDWLHDQGMRWFPIVGWAERGGSFAPGHGNSVPRFHISWGTGPGVLEPFLAKAQMCEAQGLLRFEYRHQVREIICQNGVVTGVSGNVLAPDQAGRSVATNRECVGEFEVEAGAVILASGGMGGNKAMVRQHWPVDRLGPPPKTMLCGVPAHVDGKMFSVAADAGASLINMDRMWHYTEGVKNFDPVWPDHGIRILPGPSSMWFDALGQRLQPPCLPGFDTLSTLKAIVGTGYDYSWFILSQKIIEKEFALSGSEQNPDFTSKKWSEVIKSRFAKGATAPVEAFKMNGEDFVVSNNLEDLVGRMNKLTDESLLDFQSIQRQIEFRDRQIDNPFSKDVQVTAIHGARNYLGDKLVRTARPHKILDPKNGPLIGVKLHILTRKTLGGIETNLNGQVLDSEGNPIAGLYAAGEVSGFGGGGYHGKNALEGTFLGGCLFSGKIAGRHAGSV